MRNTVSEVALLELDEVADHVDRLTQTLDQFDDQLLAAIITSANRYLMFPRPFHR
jgi:hypothetical protein